MKKVQIKLNTSNALRWLGSLYRSPAEAIKEHVSNAVDEHAKALENGEALSACDVRFHIEKKRITVEYPYGMSRQEFQDALERVADSAKKSLDANLIGQLGIGMFSFLQIGRKCVFYSKKAKGYEGVKVTLRDGSDEANFETPRSKERVVDRGIRIVISDLKFDPTKPRGPLAAARLQRVFADKYDRFLRSGDLKIHIRMDGRSHTVKPRKINLPRIGTDYRKWHLPNDKTKCIGLELYFDPSGRSQVSIRHMGVAIIEDIAAAEAYGLEDTMYAGGHIKGFIDADFLSPLPARTGFEDNDDWLRFLTELDRIRPAIEAELGEFRQAQTEEKLAEVKRKAVELARDILNTEEFGDLELLEGLGRKARTHRIPPRGFAFSPTSLRIEQDKRGRISLKALVPHAVPGGTEVTFEVSGPAVELKTGEAILNADDADRRGVVTVPVFFVAREPAAEPVVLSARAGTLTAEARIRVSEFKLTARQPAGGEEGEGKGIQYSVLPFEYGPARHSRYTSRVVEINELNENYKREVLLGSEESQLAYAAMMIGKETIAFNDKSGDVDEYLEKLLSYYFTLRSRVQSSKRHRRKPEAK